MSEPASPARLASERRVMRLLRSALIFLEQRSADLPSVWKFVVPSRERGRFSASTAQTEAETRKGDQGQ